MKLPETRNHWMEFCLRIDCRKCPVNDHIDGLYLYCFVKKNGIGYKSECFLRNYQEKFGINIAED